MNTVEGKYMYLLSTNPQVQTCHIHCTYTNKQLLQLLFV